MIRIKDWSGRRCFGWVVALLSLVFYLGGTSLAAVHEETQTGGSTSSTTVSTSAGLQLENGQLYLASISAKPNVSVTSVSGLGLNWTLVREQCGGRDTTGVALFMAQGAPTGDGIVTATLSSIPKNAVIAVSRYSNVDLIDPVGSVVSANTNGLDGACSAGVDSSAYLLNMVTTVDGAVVYGSAALRLRTHTPGQGYTEQFEIRQGSGGNAAGVAGEDMTVPFASFVDVDGTLNSTMDWAVVAVEIKPYAGSPGNQAPAVDAGLDQTIVMGMNADLNGTVTDDNLPFGHTTISWSKVSGPGEVVFQDASAEQTTASFSISGEYVLRLTANDGDLEGSAEVTITVNTENTFSIGSNGRTTDKPQSKLWFNDGAWWAVLPDGTDLYFYKLDSGGTFVKQTFTDAKVDPNNNDRADVLWNGQRLIVLIYRGKEGARLLEYTYDGSTSAYSLVTGPVDIPLGVGQETAVIAQDSTGKLWIAYEAGNQIHVIWSTDPDHLIWDTVGFVLEDGVADGDIASIVAFDNKVGVLWSNQIADHYAFSVHADGAAENIWGPVEVVTQGNTNNHINLAVTNGQDVLAAIKRGEGAASVIELVVRWKSTGWDAPYEVWKVATRPIVVFDREKEDVYVFYTDESNSPEPDTIDYKKANLQRLTDLTTNEGSPIISVPGLNANSVTSTKQEVDSFTDLLVVASAQSADGTDWRAYYALVNLDPAPVVNPDPVTVSFEPEADTYLEESNPTRNYGSSSRIEVGGGTTARDIYLRFNVTGLPAGAVVTDASLNMSVYNSGGAGTIRQFRPDVEAWDEMAPTWSSPVSGSDVPVDLSSPGSVSKNSVATYSGLAPAISGNGRVTFVIRSNDQDGSAFYSREEGTASRRPLLSVTY